MTRLLAAVALFGVVFVLPTEATSEDTPEIPKEIAVPAGHTKVLTLQAKGVQIYKSVAGKDGKFMWVLEAPLAELTNEKGERAGYHFGEPKLAVPAWEAADGSRLVRDKTEDVKPVLAKKPDTDIPWLLVRVKSDDGKPGTLANVVYIQRVLTEGGQPPTNAPNRADTRIGISYKASYMFYAPIKEK